ncbi:LacI family DNA-binding transcriptional regulator [Gorillibacterium massiliense]|uniref:LacI family DNA-binding transcriptional regulator n=1 Tax=Gorillibacterium massiliense TaxID=1280390 RepID=UPI0004B23FA2|nr:LacI family DNA-binding transcriptional regulator [Gorillibacterium massiliense]
MDSFEIARLAGVSRKTVTRVMNHQAGVHPETRDKVWKVIRENNYVPNAFARKLSSKTTKTIGLIILQDKSFTRIFTDDLYLGPVIGAIMNVASMRGYNVLTDMVDAEHPEAALTLFREKSIDAGVLIGWNGSEELIAEMTGNGYCFGAFDYTSIGGSGEYPVPVLDNKYSAYQAASYLLDAGHTDIGFVTGPAESSHALDRLAGFRLALAERGLSANEDRIVQGDFSEQAGEAAAKHFLAALNLPSAVFAANDWMAIGLMRGLQRRGVKIPDDVSIIGFDDLILTRYTTPSLTTMKVPTVAMGMYLINSLVDSIEGKSSLPSPSRFYAELVERESVTKLK